MAQSWTGSNNDFNQYNPSQFNNVAPQTQQVSQQPYITQNFQQNAQNQGGYQPNAYQNNQSYHHNLQWNASQPVQQMGNNHQAYLADNRQQVFQNDPLSDYQNIENQKIITRRISHQPTLYSSINNNQIQYEQLYFNQQTPQKPSEQYYVQPNPPQFQQVQQQINRSISGQMPANFYQSNQLLNTQLYNKNFISPMKNQRNFGNPKGNKYQNQSQHQQNNQRNQPNDDFVPYCPQQFEYLAQIGGGDSIQHLNLNKFKTEQCHLSYQHNHKHCKYYHTIKDKRRKNINYTTDICDFSETDRCPNKDQCILAHNRVERLYHIEKYKTKFCTYFPKNIQACEYGDFCSFAHHLKDIKTRIIHFMLKDADFYMFYFKTEWCPLNKEHNKAQCDYAHNWQDFRRKPNIFNYDAFDLCKNWQAGTFIGKYEEGCSLQAACPRSHGWKEQEFHPFTYKTRPCQEEKCSGSGQCQFYHGEHDRRYVQDLFDAMKQRPRGPMEQQIPISQANLVINNVNHLKEFLINYGLPHDDFKTLSDVIIKNQIPIVILQYIEEKGVVSSDRMKELNALNERQYSTETQPQEPQQLNDYQSDQYLKVEKKQMPCIHSDQEDNADLNQEDLAGMQSLYHKVNKSHGHKSSSSEDGKSDQEKNIERKGSHQPISWTDKLSQLKENFLKAPSIEGQSDKNSGKSIKNEKKNSMNDDKNNKDKLQQDQGIQRAITDPTLGRFTESNNEVRIASQQSQNFNFQNLIDDKEFKEMTIGEVDSSSEEGDETPPNRQKEKFDFDVDNLNAKFSTQISLSSLEFTPQSKKNSRGGFPQNQYVQILHHPQQPQPQQSYSQSYLQPPQHSHAYQYQQYPINNNMQPQPQQIYQQQAQQTFGYPQVRNQPFYNQGMIGQQQNQSPQFNHQYPFQSQNNGFNAQQRFNQQ